jgi:exonuclease SbcD
MFKFIHAADIHLDSPLRGLERYEGAPVETLRGATRRALTNLVDLALGDEVNFVIIAGDVYDGNWPDHNTGLFFTREMTRLRDARIPVYLIAGNHDAQNKMTRTLRLPDNVRMLDHRRAESVSVERCDGVTIHGQSFATQAVLDNLAAAYPAGDGGGFQIGLLHTSATGYEGHDSYAPCSLDDLRSREYDYWALGHIHQRQMLIEESPFVAFPGNLQGRHIRECGPKGCLVVSVDARGRPTSRFEPLDVVRWSECIVNATDAERGDDLLDRFSDALRQTIGQADGRLLAARVTIRGACPAHAELAARQEQWTGEFRSLALQQGDGTVWVEKVKLDTSPPSNFDLPADGPLAELLDLFAELRDDDDELHQLARELEPLAAKLPRELREGTDPLDLADPVWLRRILSQAQPMLLSRLTKGGAA